MKGTPDNRPVETQAPEEFRPTEEMRLEDAAPAPEDVPPAPTDDGPAPSSQTPHAKGMEAIVARRREQIEREKGESERVGLQQPDIAPTPLEAAPPAPPPEDTPAPPPPPLPPVADLVPAARVHRIVVRGQQIEMSEEDMVRAAGMAIESEAARREAQQRPAPQPAPAPPPAPPAPIDRAVALEYAKAIQYGDEDAAADALAKMAEEITRRVTPQAPAVSADEIANQVYARVNSVNTMEGALQRFATNFDDIVSDTDATTLAAIKADQLRQQYQNAGIPRTIDEIMTEAGNAVRATRTRWTGTPAPATDPQTPTPPAPPAPTAPAPAANGARVAIKRATPQAPAASAATPPTEQGPRLTSGATGSQTVAWLRQTRGQPVYR